MSFFKKKTDWKIFSGESHDDGVVALHRNRWSQTVGIGHVPNDFEGVAPQPLEVYPAPNGLPCLYFDSSIFVIIWFISSLSWSSFSSSSISPEAKVLARAAFIASRSK